MKRVLSATAILLLLTGAAFAQEKTKSKTATATATPAKSRPAKGGFICGTPHLAMQQRNDSISKAKSKKSCCMQPSRTAGLRAAPKKAQ